VGAQSLNLICSECLRVLHQPARKIKQRDVLVRQVCLMMIDCNLVGYFGFYAQKLQSPRVHGREIDVLVGA